MNYLHLFGWYYQGHAGEPVARNSYEKLRLSIRKGIEFPFNSPYQVGLVHCKARGEEHWCVGILVMSGSETDDSMEQANKLRKWFDECDASLSNTDKRCEPALHSSVEETLQSRYPIGNYTVVEAFDALSNTIKDTHSNTIKEINCFRCNKGPEKRLLNGEYWCEECNKSYSAAEVRAHLMESLKETEQRGLQNECAKCGRQLIKPDWTTRSGLWCTWCGSEPESGEDIINLLREKISVCDEVIAEGEPVVFKNARSGDKEAIERIFKESFKYKVGESVFKSFTGLGAVVVDFLIKNLNSTEKSNAINALGEICDERAVEPLIKAIKTTAEGIEGRDACEVNFHVIWALDKIGSSGVFVQLLNLLERNYGVQGSSLQDSLQFKIVDVMRSILERAGAEIPVNALIAASEVKNMSVRLFRFIETGEAEDAYGKYTSGYRSFVTETVDCESLREAAQRELKSRGLV